MNFHGMPDGFQAGRYPKNGSSAVPFFTYLSAKLYDHES